jgi:hypothetical protein
MRGYRPEPPRVPRPVTSSNFEEWIMDARNLTFEEYMGEMVPAWRPILPPPPAPPLREVCR